MAAHDPESDAKSAIDPKFPCSLTVDVPFPTACLASFALQTLQVDKELSSLVCRSFSLLSTAAANSPAAGEQLATQLADLVRLDEETVLRAEYKATTNRMLRVAVNGFMESLATVLGVMEELDVDVLGGQATE